MQRSAFTGGWALRPLALAAAAVLVVLAVPASTAPRGDGEGEGAWSRLPLPSAQDRYVHQMVMEPGGMIWVMTSGSLYYWDGERFRPPVTGALRSGQYAASLYGGPDRGAYATQAGDKYHWGKIFTLSDGEARYVTGFYYDVPTEPPGLYVSASGRLYNWGRRFLAVYSKGEWKRIEAELSASDTLIFDRGKTVHFYYSRRLYSADSSDNLTITEVSGVPMTVEGQTRVHGALWGDRKILLLDPGRRGVYAHDLVTGKPVPTDGIDRGLGQRAVYDLFRAADGSVWVLGDDRDTQSYKFLRVSAKGEVTPVEETVRLGWENIRCWQFPRSVLNASDGSIWFGLPTGGVARYKDGDLRIFDWKDGLNIGSANYLSEDPQRKIYVASDEGVYVFLPGGTPQPLPGHLRLWDEYLSASYHPIRDSAGNVWMFLKERPGEVSRWDGSQWHHVPVPFDTSRVLYALSDDRGHILLHMQMIPGGEGCFDVGPNGATRYENIRSMIAAAVADGARRFDTGPDFAGCYVLDGGKISFGYRFPDRFYYFDGEKWDSFEVGDNVHYIYESPRHGFIVRTRTGGYYCYDRGQVVQLEYPESTLRWILGPKHIQPFEEALLKLRPGLYEPVERAPDGKYRFPAACAKAPAGGSAGPGYVMGDALPTSIWSLTPGYFGGYWTDYDTEGPYRIFGGRVFRCDFSDSPLVGKIVNIWMVVEDRARNVWIDARWYAGAGHVFVKRLNNFRLEVEGFPTQVKRSLAATVKPTLPGLPAEKLRLFWRFKGGQWCGGEPGNRLTIPFLTPGRYHIEVVGMDLVGGLSEITPLVVEAAVPLPETTLTRKGPYAVRDVLWRVPAEPVPSEPGAFPQLFYRVDGGEWKLVPDGKAIPMGGLKIGLHTVEVAAQEGEVWRDPTPLRLRLKYAPDFNFIVESRLDILASGNLERAAAALSEIKMAGPEVIPILREKLSDARRWAALAPWLEDLVRALEREPGVPSGAPR